MTAKRGVQILTFGCQMNKLDSELMREQMLTAGWEITDREAGATAIIFSTCAVREHAEERVIQRVRQIKDRGAIVAITGCAAEHLGADIFRILPQVRVVCGTRHFPRIAEFINRALNGERVVAVGENIEPAEISAPSTIDSAKSTAEISHDSHDENADVGIIGAHERARHRGFQGFVSAMRGCNNFCSYCIVPYVRGREESRPADEIVAEALAVAKRGALEITLLGQNIDAYGKAQNSSLAELLARLDDALPPTVKRIRFVTSHPRDITENLLRTIADRSRIAKHLHMPAQSGADKILAAMRRGYTRAMYEERLKMIAGITPTALVTSDFIVGFCGENSDDFAATVDLIERAHFQNVYVFKYSPRPGTWATENLADDVPNEIKKERNQILLRAQENISAERHRQCEGKILRVLVEGVSAKNSAHWHGRAINNLNVVFSPRTEIAVGDFCDLKIIRSSPLTLFGEIVEK